ncbi:MAG: hypothetical protein A3C84_00605 [Candidatus Ryanbacteria bacterium RIFCSPHIGHO2_02_FULL_48_12]|uniref:Uncharacterized protein n=1 Tax=Candidatus Ryanbacteria bacterium RIFCSPHIGHO2_01_FULL_48_27 TaxID=1802115 RepID=A0A1G2G773_9BACT|nr:MAG: hypothetical protein A2756_02525 [Candidatus Ryanbacteria bacterium RIFCSPHIGHO2_01_FULL_48_27]OGZ49286.1 MAG: hypothetical protein A3C84_00605 [Candidatus Ryanbacteria bacterium RIFCSPHIGHO2_02_FULL_48_12]
MRRDFLKKICIGIALLLLASFVIHAIILDHDHPHDLFGDGVQAFLHGDYKKWWLFGVLVYVAFLSVRRKSLCVRMLEQKMYARVRYAWFTQGSCRIFDVMQEMMRTGILHPKLCA